MASIVQYVERPSVKQSEIVDDIRRRIADGGYAPGRRLPSLNEIAQHYGACRVTAQRAMQHLAASGHVIVKKSFGTFVSPHPPTLCNIALVFHRKPEQSQMLLAWKRDKRPHSALTVTSRNSTGEVAPLRRREDVPERSSQCRSTLL